MGEVSLVCGFVIKVLDVCVRRACVCVIVQFPSLQSIVGQGEKKRKQRKKNLDPKPLQVAY